MPMSAPRPRQPKRLAAGPFQPAISSFRLHLNAEGKSPKTVRTYVEAVQWFAAAYRRASTDHAVGSGTGSPAPPLAPRSGRHHRARPELVPQVPPRVGLTLG